jgi:hypothetical protein
MIIHVKQACEFVNKDGEKFRCPNGFIGVPPEWVAHNDYFKSMCDSGLITAHVDTKSVDAEAEKSEKSDNKKKK